jgi:hypothetical protein
MNRCARCSWDPHTGESLEEHAEAAGHPLCTACSQSLPSDRPRVCRDCQDQASEKLHEILVMWAELPDLLEAHANGKLPGGDVLVLAGPGARGVQGADDADTRREIDDNRNAYVPSVAWTLVSWADDWQHVRGETEPPRWHDRSHSDPDKDDQDSAAAHDRVVERAHDYLVEHNAWAAREHWAWAEYLADLKHLHAALLRATGRHRAPGRLNLSCFACSGPLQFRIISDKDADPPPSRPRWWVSKHVHGPVDAAEWARRHLGNAGLEEDDATCRDCGLKYTVAALLLAQRQAVEDAMWLNDPDGTVWGTVRAVADYVNRSHWSLRTWERQGLIRSSRHGGEIYLCLPDVEAEVALRAPRPARQKTS